MNVNGQTMLNTPILVELAADLRQLPSYLKNNVKYASPESNSLETMIGKHSNVNII